MISSFNILAQEGVAGNAEPPGEMDTFCPYLKPVFILNQLLTYFFIPFS